MEVERLDDLPNFLTSDASIALPLDFFDADRLSFFKCSDKPVTEIEIRKLPLHWNKFKNRHQRKVVIVVSEAGTDYKPNTWVGDLTPDGLVFEESLSNCVADQCPVFSYNKEEKANLVSVLGTSIAEI